MTDKRKEVVGIDKVANELHKLLYWLKCFLKPGHDTFGTKPRDVEWTLFCPGCVEEFEVRNQK
jgi:hypothetical protein